MSMDPFIYICYCKFCIFRFSALVLSEGRWRGCLGRCVHTYVLLIGGSNPALPQWPMFCISFSCFFFKIFPKIAFIVYNTGELRLYDCKLLLLDCPLLSKFDKLFFSRGHFVVRANSIIVLINAKC
jgi:hypothetical protein